MAYDKIMDVVGGLTKENVLKRLYFLSSAATRPTGYDLFMCGDGTSMPSDAYMLIWIVLTRIKAGDKLYVGSVMSYRWVWQG